MFFTLRLTTGLKLVLAAWTIAEVIAFALVAEWIGVPEALLLAFLTSLFGWTLLKKAGASAMTKLRAAVDGRRVVDGDRRDVMDDTLASFGALALMMPGFLSDAVGLALAIPAARDRITVWVGRRGGFAGLRPGGKRPQHGPSTIDLDPQDWQRQDRERQSFQRNDPAQEPLSRS